MVLIADGEGQTELPQSKICVVLLTGVNHWQKLLTGCQQQRGCGGINRLDVIALYQKTGLGDLIQKICYLSFLFHAAPPDVDSLCRLGENFPGGFQENSTAPFYRNRTKIASKITKR